MQLNCETEELRQMALLMFGDKIKVLEERADTLQERCDQKDEYIRQLEAIIRERDEKITKQQNQIVELSMKINETTMTTWAIQQYLVLSQQKAKIYVRSVDNNMKAQLGQFMFQSLPDNAPTVLLDYVRDVTQPETPPTTMIVAQPTMPSYTDNQIARALKGCVGKGCVIDKMWKWAGAYWYLRWACNYPVDPQECCKRITALADDDGWLIPCDYNNIRRYATLSFMNYDATQMSSVKCSKSDEVVFAQCREIALKVAEELAKIYAEDC